MAGTVHSRTFGTSGVKRVTSEGNVLHGFHFATKFEQGIRSCTKQLTLGEEMATRSAPVNP